MNCHIANEFDENSKIFIGSIGKVAIAKANEWKTMQDDGICEADISPNFDSFDFNSVFLKGEIYELTNQSNSLGIQITAPIFRQRKSSGKAIRSEILSLRCRMPRSRPMAKSSLVGLHISATWLILSYALAVGSAATTVVCTINVGVNPAVLAGTLMLRRSGDGL